MARPVELTLLALPVLNKLVIGGHALEVRSWHEREVLLTLLIVFTDGSRCAALLPVEDVAILLEYQVNQGAFADT